MNKMLLLQYVISFLLCAVADADSLPGENSLSPNILEIGSIQPEHPGSSIHSKMEEQIDVRTDVRKLPFRPEHSGNSIHSKYDSYSDAVRGSKKFGFTQHPKSSAQVELNMQSKGTRGPNNIPLQLNHLTRSDSPAQFKQSDSTQEIKDEPTKYIESNVLPEQKFMFVAQSKLADIMQQQSYNGFSSSDDNTADWMNDSGPNTCNYDERRSVTFQQAKDAMIQAWKQCNGNPQCQLMQIQGGIDNLLVLHHCLIEQVSFLDKLLVIQRKLIADNFEEISDTLPTFKEKDNNASDNTTDGGNLIEPLQYETEDNNRDNKNISQTQSEFPDNDQDFNNLLDATKVSNMSKSTYHGMKAPGKKSSILVNSPRAVGMRYKGRIHKRSRKQLSKKVTEKETMNQVIKSNIDIVHLQTQSPPSLVKKEFGSKKEHSHPKQEESGTMTGFLSRKILQDESELTGRVRFNGCQQALDLEKEESGTINGFLSRKLLQDESDDGVAAKTAGAKVEEAKSAGDILAWKCVQVGLVGLVGGLYLCYYLYHERATEFRTFFCFASFSLYIVYTFLAIQVMSM